ncbi:MAG: DUF192 domain-containing protein [Patescibacteria group bacterium]|nr:DUF192 domain-containing protein [Patescibacteria group bacterium]
MTRTIPVLFLLVLVAGILGVLGYLFTGQYRTQSASAALAYASFSGNAIDLEIATSTADQARGLGGRASIPDDYGMLFIFPKDDTYGFWMKDMLAPIDIFWLSDSGRVVSMKTDVSPSTYPNVFYPDSPARYVLETRAGYAAAHGITGTSTLDGLTFLTGVSK